jgi:hypothetical protein
MTPGEMLVAVTRAGDYSPPALARKAVSIRREMQAKMADSDAMLSAAHKTANAFAELAEYLNGKTSVVPTGLPQAVADAARVVKRASESGVYQPATLASEVERHATAALLTLSDSSKTLARVKSAGSVALANRAMGSFRKAAGDIGYSKADRERLIRSSFGYEAVYTRAKKRHAERHFDEVELAKTFRGIEMKHTGIEVSR